MIGRVLSAETFHSLVRFGLSGVVSSTVALGTAALLHEWAELPERPAGGLGFVAALLVNFFVLRVFVFRATHDAAWRQALTYLATSGMFRLFEFFAFYIVNKYVHVQYLIAMVLVLGVSFVVKFVTYRGFVFRGPGQVAR